MADKKAQAGTKLIDAEALQKQLNDVRAEAAKYRTELNEKTAEIDALKPLAEQAAKLAEEEKTKNDAKKTEMERMAEQMEALQSQVTASQQAAEAMTRLNAITKLAHSAHVPDDVLEMLDLSKIDVADPETAVKQLAVFAKPAGNIPSVNQEKKNGAGMTRAAFSAMTVDERVAALSENPNLGAELTG